VPRAAHRGDDAGTERRQRPHGNQRVEAQAAAANPGGGAQRERVDEDQHAGIARPSITQRNTGTAAGSTLPV
jgi:hypothetical protein